VRTVDRPRHDGDVKVVARSTDGSWDLWRVGRRRLAFKPGVGWLVDVTAADGVLGVALGALALAVVVAVWTAAIVATVVVWPWRELSGNWPVVAYALTGGPAGEGHERLVTVRGKAAADALVKRWADEIKASGQPVSEPSPK
jgi:hypothetical protein